MATKINFNKNNQLLKFDDLQIGDAFIFDNGLYIRVDQANNAVYLPSGEVLSFDEDTLIFIKVNLTIDVNYQ